MVSCRASVHLGCRSRANRVCNQEAAVFLKKRAVIEEEYGKSLQKLSRGTAEVYSMNDGKAGCVVRTTMMELSNSSLQNIRNRLAVVYAYTRAYV